MRSSIALACASLVACGGGGGGGAGVEDNGWLTFAPARLEVSFHRGDPTSATVVASSSRVLDGPVQVGVLDPDGVLTGSVLLDLRGTQVSVGLRLNPALAARVHAGSLEVRVCRDRPDRCAEPWGGPWQLPYRITVLPGTNLTPLSALSGAMPWRTVGGDAGHTGFVPATVDPARFGRRWSVPVLEPWVKASDVGFAVEGGRVYLLAGQYGSGWKVTAYSEADGQVDWASDLGTLLWVGQPAAGHGHVYAASSAGSTGTALWVLDQATGALVKRLPMTSQFDRWGPPEIHGDAVYTPSGMYGGLSRFDGVQLSESWFSSSAPWFTRPYTPLADGAFVYMYAAGGLLALNAADGTLAFQIPVASSSGGAAPGLAPVLGPSGGVFHAFIPEFGRTAGAARLVRFDVIQRTSPWARAGSYNSEPVVAGGVLYIVNGEVLEALAAETGERLWSWTIPGAPPGPDVQTNRVRRQEVLVVGRHAFVTAAQALHVVDIDTHQQVWSHPVAGRLAVSENGVLYVLTWEGRLVAVNLR